MYVCIYIFIYFIFWGPNPSRVVLLDKKYFIFKKMKNSVMWFFWDAIRKWPEWFCELKEETYLYFQCFVTKSRLNRYFGSTNGLHLSKGCYVVSKTTNIYSQPVVHHWCLQIVVRILISLAMFANNYEQLLAIIVKHTMGKKKPAAPHAIRIGEFCTLDYTISIGG